MAGQSGAYRLVPGAWPQVRRSQLEVAALDTAPGCLRLRTRTVLREWGLAMFPGVEDFPGTVELLVSELVTNSVEAVQAPEAAAVPSWLPGILPECPCVELRLSLDDQKLLIEVWDAHPAPPPQPSLPDLDAPSGRGLFLVEQLSHDWGFYYPALPGSHDAHRLERFRPAPAPVPPELRWVTGKVVWCELMRATYASAAS
jgi:hypothetical protein